jgi:E3 ubiquitin-protein ligase DCST1
MGMNAKEVVRVFACSTELSQNLSDARYAAVGEPYQKALSGLKAEMNQVKDTIK